MELGDLRLLTTKQIFKALQDFADPEVAALAAWYVLHNRSPKKNISFLYNNAQKPKISKRIINLILENYQRNKITGQTNSLLPI